MAMLAITQNNSLRIDGIAEAMIAEVLSRAFEKLVNELGLGDYSGSKRQGFCTTG